MKATAETRQTFTRYGGDATENLHQWELSGEQWSNGGARQG